MGQTQRNIYCLASFIPKFGSKTINIPLSLVLILSAQHVSFLKTDEDQTQRNIYCLASKLWDEGTPCDTLPPPNIISGLTAALLTESQMTGKKSLSVLVFTEMMTVDSLSLTPFKIIHQIDS